jgi:hypothetical protein
LSPLVALFVGGIVAGRAAGSQGRGLGALHGLVTWGLTTILGAWLLVNLVSSLVGGVFSAGKAAVQAGGAAVGAVGRAGGGAAKMFGIDADDAIGPLNQRLMSEGRPTITADQLRAATGNAARDAVRTGRLDRDQLVGALTAQTALTPGDAEQVADRVQAQFGRWRGQASAGLETAKEKAQAGARKAAGVTARAMWGVFVALLFGLLAAIVGGILGARPLPIVLKPRPTREPEREPDRGPLTGREVYP